MALTVPVDEIVANNSNGLLGKHATWRRVRIGDIATVKNGAAFKSARFNDEARGLPLIRIRDVQRDHTAVHYDGPYEDGYIVRTGDLVIGMDGGFSSALWSGPTALLNQRVCRIDFHTDEINRKFVYYALQGYLDAVNEVTSAVTVKHLSSKTVSELPMPLPPRAEQDRIVEAVESAMAAVEEAEASLDQAEERTEALRLSVLAAAVTGGLSANVSSSTESADQLLAQILEERAASEGSRSKPPASPQPPEGIILPPDWTWATVDQLSTIVQYGTSSKTSEDPSGVPVLRMGNIVGGRINLEKLKYLPTTHSEFPELLLEDGDLLFNRTNSPELVGKAAVYRGDPEPCSYASYLIRVRFSGHYRPELLNYFLGSALGRRWVASVVSQQVGQANVNGTKLKQLSVPLPPRQVQEEVCRVAEAQLEQIALMRRQISFARQSADVLRRSILYRAFAGNLVPQNPGDEPASELLSRINAENAEREAEMKAAKSRTRKQTAERRSAAAATATGAERS